MKCVGNKKIHADGEPNCDRCVDFSTTHDEYNQLRRGFDPLVNGGPHERLIPGCGDINARGMLVGEAGGQTEHHRRRPFAGKSGDSLTTYCLAAGIARPDLWITNTYPFWTGPGNPDPTPEEISAQEWRLYKDIKLVNPIVIGAVGRIATQWFLGPDVDMEVVHGTPMWSDKAPGALIVPIYHPAAGFYNPALAAFAQNDIMLFAHYLKNPVKPRKPEPWVVKEQSWPHGTTRTYVDGATDTEGLPDKPWGLSWSGDGKRADVVLAGNRVRFKGRQTFHNALHDLAVLRALDIPTRHMDFDDTMVMAFNLQLEPQALKSLTFRHIGIKMTEFMETVRPYYDPLALKWFKKVAKHKFKKWPEQAVEDYPKKRVRFYTPQHPGQRAKNVLRSYEKDPVKTKLEKRFADFDEVSPGLRGAVEPDNRAMGEYVAGPFPEVSIFCVPKAKSVAYSGLDAIATHRVKPVLMKMIKERGLTQVYEMDRRAIPFVDRMQEVGMRINVPMLSELEEHTASVREKALRAVKRVTGDRWFNPGSGDQVAAWLYSLKGLPVKRRTESGRGSTSDETLQMLRGYHAHDEEVATFITGVQDYREADKYLGTFIAPIFLYMRRDKHGNWRVHPNFRITRVVSGRLSSFDPNVLAFPTRTELGKRIRYCFEAQEGYVIVSADASQIELRMMAHLCGDWKMREAFETGVDLHALTASIIFKVPIAEIMEHKDGIHSAKRYVAKTINFAVMYGITAQALLEQLFKANIFDYTLEDCEAFIKKWFDVFPAVQRFLRALWKQAAKDGYVRDMWGRICYIPNLNVMDSQMRAAAERLCGNFPVQSGAHGLVKRAEIRLWDWINADDERYDHILPWLQMHDELDLEVRADLAEETERRVISYMEKDAHMFKVPIVAEGRKRDKKTGLPKPFARSWGGAK